jgi:hypothetical protein
MAACAIVYVLSLLGQRSTIGDVDFGVIHREEPPDSTSQQLSKLIQTSRTDPAPTTSAALNLSFRRKVKGFIDHPYCALGLLMLLSVVLSDCDRTRLVSGRRPAHQSGAGGSIAACWRECDVGSETACD